MKKIEIEKAWLEEQYVALKKSIAQIASESGICKAVIGNRLREHGIPRRPASQNFDDLTGRRFGRLMVTGFARKGKRGRTIWDCLCDCGRSKPVDRSSLIHGLTQSCGCLKFEKAFRGSGRLSGSYWNRIVRGAESRGLPVTISMEDAWEEFEAQAGRCALSGLPIEIVTNYTHRHDEHTASLDRKDNDRGYEPGNVQWVHRVINMMRRAMSVADFVSFCKAVAAHHGGMAA